MATIIKVPCSSANIGPGFDVIGLALSIYLEIHVEIDETLPGQPLNCVIEYSGVGKDEVSLDPERNLITRVALYVLRCAGQRAFPVTTRVQVKNPVPLGRGLGSSACAVVGGVALANEVGKLNLTKARMLDYCLMIERHPDNVAAALYGGFIGTYLNELSKEDLGRKEIPLAEVLPEPAGGINTGQRPPEPPLDIGHYMRFKWAPEIKCIAIIPQFEVATAKAREVLPQTYSRPDIIFNLQRLALLTTALGQSPPDADMIYRAMQDKIHQPYRKTLIPGLTEILQSVTPSSHPGLLGVCLSGAGPTILALATHNFEGIATHIVNEFKKNDVTCDWQLLEPAEDGTTVTYPKDNQADKPEALTYASAGVSIDRGNELVRRIKAAVATTKRPGADAEIGGFGGSFDLLAAGFTEPPILVSGIDGIGTKVKIAFEMKKHSTVGIDLVAMNVNDIVVQGARPLFFLDYYACSALNVDDTASFVEGVAEGCRQAECTLVGGETAEMPGLYSAGEYDAGGAAIGGLARNQRVLPDKANMTAGDVLLGLQSSGVHSNGYSLVRKIVERAGLSYHDPAPWEASTSVGESLLVPTRIYVKSLLAAVAKDLLKGMAHITGGGLVENIPRMLPKDLEAVVDASSWPLQPVFKWLKTAGALENAEFARVWNTGIGMAIVVAPEKVEEAKKVLSEAGETVYTIGKLEKRDSGEGCKVMNTEAWN